MTYQGGLVIESRSVNLYGTQEGERRTTFTGPIRMDADSDRWICYVKQIDFRGTGDGVAISTSARVRAEVAPSPAGIPACWAMAQRG